MIPIHSYKTKIASRYIPVDADQIGLKIAESEYYLASVKHDGHLAFLSVKKGKAQLFDRNGDELKIDAIAKAAASIKVDFIVAGELCCFENGQSTSHREVSAALAKPTAFDVRFAAFDLLEINGEAANPDPKEHLHQLQNLLDKGKEVFAIEQHHYESRKDLIAFFKTTVEQKTEGMIVKVPNGITYKVKQTHLLDLVVLGYAESTGDREGWLRELLLGFAIGKNQYQIVTKCGGGFSDSERQELPQNLQKMAAESEYTEVSGAKTAFIFVKPELVVEISLLDLINENSDGAIRKALLTYDAKKGYTYEGNEHTLSIISPNFIRIRSDKKANEKEAGPAQAYALKEPLESTAESVLGKDSKIIVREVFNKVGKGGTAIRKFVGLKTNKEETGLYPPFVVIFSDYAAGRKTPLEQELFLCNTEKEVQAKVNALKEDNIKKGWEAHN
jgi:ATP-dependent DNA ligase